jgi:hypothetical protein
VSWSSACTAAGNANRAAPVNAFDAACWAHDLCYGWLGRGACSCGRAFLQATTALVKSRKVPDTVRSKAATANSLFSVTLCTEPKKPGATSDSADFV